MSIEVKQLLAAAGQFSELNRDRLRRQQIYIHHDISTGHTFQKSIFLPFSPSSVIVRQLTFNMAPPAHDTYLLRAMNLDNTILGMVTANNAPVEPGITIDLSGKHVGPTLHLQLQDLDEDASTAAVGLVSAILEFVE